MTFVGLKLSVALPDTVLEERDSLREKTVKLGQIARSCSIFGVDLIQIFRDPHGRGEAGLVKKILKYLETPQYLRKRLFQLDESLKFAGLLPPLRIPSHKPKVPLEQLRVGDFREGVVLSGNEVDVGLDGFLRLKGVVAAPHTKRVTVKVASTNPLECVLAGREQIKEYWGYEVEVRSVDEVLSDKRFQLKIATSKFGSDLEDSVGRLGEELSKVQSAKLIFGPPSRSLFEIVGKGLEERVDFVLNLFLEQHVVTVRTEEAIFSALSLINAIFALRKFKG